MKTKLARPDYSSDEWWENVYRGEIVPQVHAKLDEVAAKAAAWWAENHNKQTQ